MGYLDNTVIEIDAILTKKGRELLSKGADNFKITQFALADDEVDYRLWNPDHTLGSNYYGEVIENMPILEANPNETQIMKYKLLTLGKMTVRIPIISVGLSNLILSAGQTYIITPITVNYENGNSTYGYTATISDQSVASIEPLAGYEINQGQGNTPPSTIPNPNQQYSYPHTSLSATGQRFLLTARSLYWDGFASITIIGNETGGSVSINLTVQRMEQTALQTPPINLT